MDFRSVFEEFTFWNKLNRKKLYGKGEGTNELFNLLGV